MEKGRNPFAVLMITVPPDFVDVNVHPTKAEVRFQDTSVVFAAVQRTVRQGVLGYKQASRHDSYGHYQQEERGWSIPYDRKRQMDMEMPLDEGQSLPRVDDFNPNDPTAIPHGMGRPEKPRTLPLLRVVGQVGAAYIVAEGPAGMYLVDQHAAHTRILYQELSELYQQQNELPHRQLESQTIDLSVHDSQLLEKYLDSLNSLGFILEAFGSNTYLIRGIPTVLATGDASNHLWNILERLGEKPKDIHEALLIRIAERAAIKSGQVLNIDDMRSLIRKLERCPEPQSSPTGQSTFIHMSAQELEREFTRNK
jgi:DNA mismatch repair protein MutL